MRAPALTLPRLALVLAGIAGAAGAQAGKPGGSGPQVLPPGPAAPELPDLPPLPELTPSSPRNTMLYADRFEVRPSPAAMQQAAAVTTGQLVHVQIPKEVTGTGFWEWVEYLVPSSYEPGTPIPLLLAWHGYGSSCKSVSLQTTLDEECEARGWAYLSITGIDDSLLSTSLVNQNVAAAIGWLSAQVDIDPTRLYGVGFSAGAGCISNFAARHRDPAGPIFAGLGLVSGSYDWTQIWWLDPAMRPSLELVWNFGAPPNLAPFAYQRASAMYFTPGSYPPQPGTLQILKSMAQNLGGTPAWITWDTGDTIAYLPAQSTALGNLLSGIGGRASLHPVSGTVDGEGDPATHSWAVMDANALCDYLAPLVAELQPDAVRALVDEPRLVSWMTIDPAAPSTFAAVQGTASGGAGFEVHDVTGAKRVHIAPDAPAPWELDVQVGAGQTGWTVVFDDTGTPAGWAEDSPGHGTPAFEFEPDGDGLVLPVLDDSSLTVQAHAWDAELTLLPDPAPTGSLVHLRVDAPPGPALCWLIASTEAAPLTFAETHVLLVQPVVPFILLTLPLNGAGNVDIQTLVPKDPTLSGMWLLLQTVLPGQSMAGGTTNPFRFDIE